MPGCPQQFPGITEINAIGNKGRKQVFQKGDTELERPVFEDATVQGEVKWKPWR